MTPINLLLFGDQTVEKLSSIQSLVRHSKASPAARRFLQEATDVVQLEFSKLSAEDHGWNGEFHTLLGLAENNAGLEDSNGMIATVLMCVGRLGELILYAVEDPSILGSESSPTEFLAFCTGLLPAAAAVAARDTSELFKFGIEIISITFRMAFEIGRRMKLTEDSDGSWAVTIVGTTVEKTQAILDDFHSSQNIPEPRRLAIGVVSKGWLTLIGPPSTFPRLWAWSPELDQAPKVKTDTNGPIHTTHMPGIDLEKVLGDSPLLDTPITFKARIISPGSCKPYEHTTLRSLLREMITDIAHNVLYLSGTTEESISGLVGNGKVRLTVAGPTGHLPAVQRALKDKGIEFELNQHRELRIADNARGGSDLVAIVGMSGRFPGSETIEGFWEDLLAGKNHIKKVPKSRFDLDVFYDPTGKKKNSTTAQHGGWLDRPGMFDNRLFNVSPREAAQMDPIQRLFLTTSYEALESAGYSPNATLATESSRIATYFGQTSDDWHEVLNNEGIDIYYVPSLARAFAPGRVNYQYKWGGGSYALDSACATSTTAISLACSALIARECDTALAGGGSVLVSPNSFSGLSKSGMISNTGGCRTFHDDADGYARGEGIGVVVLKRLEDAVADNDNILGVIRGSARTYSSTSTSITHPSAKSQQRVYDEVLRQTSVDPNSVSYVEMHGTGTQAGDFEEITSVIKTLGRNRTRDNPLTVGAVKANVGHGEAAAGVTALIKVLMMMRERKVPPQPDMPFKLNSNFPPLDRLNVRIASRDMVLKPSPVGNGKVTVMLNSFDASGGNTSLVIEDAPERPAKMEDPRPFHAVAISARTTASLQKNRQRLLDYLDRHPDTKLADLAYTTTARRMHEVLRVAYKASSTNELARLLRADVTKGTMNDPKTKPANTAKVFAFTGQGSQYAGMGKELYQQSTAFRDVLLTYQDMADILSLPRFVDLISGGALDITSESPVSVQLAVVALEIAIAHVLKIWGVQPDLVIGHSLGEYAALCVAGVLSVSDTLFLVGQRAILMEKKLTAGTYSMLAVGKDAESLRKSLDSRNLSSCQVACINAPNATVGSGTVSDIAELQSQLKAEGIKTTVLNVPYGFHSTQIEPILDEFKEIAKGVVFSTPAIPVASTLMGAIVKDGSTFSPSYLARQAREPVNFVGALEASKSASLVNDRTLFIEIGPEPICMGLIRGTLDVPSARLLPSLKSSENNWSTISSSLAAVYRSGTSVNWPEYHRGFKHCLTLLDLPTYAFDEKDFWTSYVEPQGPAYAIESPKKVVEVPPAPSVPGFPTTSLQRVENEDISGKKISVTFASHTSDPNLYKAIRGHVVNGLTICPMSIFCDMAMSASKYVHSRLKPNENTPKMTLWNIDMTHALVVPKIDQKQLVQVTASYSTESDTVEISFFSIDESGSHEHGSCQVAFGDNDAWKSKQSQTLFLLRSRMDSLRELATVGKAHRLLKPVIYKLFANLVVYGEKYQGLEELYLDSECCDAVGTVKLPAVAGSGHFLFNPYWIDSAVHLAGFLLNGNLRYTDDIACLSTGFESWRQFEDLSEEKTYTTYVCMQEVEKSSIITGDAFVFNGSNLVLATTGIKFQKMKKLVLNSILQPSGPSSSMPSKGHTLYDKSSNAIKNLGKALSNGIQKRVSYSKETKSSASDRSESPDRTGYSTPYDGATTSPSSVDDDEMDVVGVLLSAVAAESGYNFEDMEADTAFADMGVDSLMAITVFASVKRDTGVELPGTFFLDHLTVGEAKAALGMVGDSKPINSIVQEADEANFQQEPPVQTTQKETPNSLHDKALPAPKTTPSSVAPSKEAGAHPCKVILLQGVQSLGKPALFLLPDESGSPATYIPLPPLGADLCVYGVESPFVRNPSDYKCTVEEMADIFVVAIRKQQPTGPYMLGGFSFGALYAYEVARKLLELNKQMLGLLIMDMAVPKPVHDSFEPTLGEIKEAGLLSSVGRQTEVQKEHVQRTVKAFMHHSFIPIPSERQPRKTVLISAMSGFSDLKDQSLRLTKWIKNWSTSATKGWEELISEIESHEIEADHFSLLRYPKVKVFGQICQDAIAKFRA